MNTNSALIIPPQLNASNSTEQLTFQEEAKPPLVISNGWLWLWFALGTAALVLVAYLLWRRWRKNANALPSVPEIPPHQRARRKLEQALALISEPKPFSTLVSDTVRVYLEERFEFHAPERTTEEFLHELQSTNLLTPDQKQSLANFLSSCDLVKFARYEPTEVELRALHSSAVRLVDETEPLPIPSEIGSSQSTNRGAQSAIQ